MGAGQVIETIIKNETHRTIKQ